MPTFKLISHDLCPYVQRARIVLGELLPVGVSHPLGHGRRGDCDVLLAACHAPVMRAGAIVRQGGPSLNEVHFASFFARGGRFP